METLKHIDVSMEALEKNKQSIYKAPQADRHFHHPVIRVSCRGTSNTQAQGTWKCEKKSNKWMIYYVKLTAASNFDVFFLCFLGFLLFVYILNAHPV